MSAKAKSTWRCYNNKWVAFKNWCQQNGSNPFTCPLGVILDYLALLLGRGLEASAIGVYVAAVTACHQTLDGKTVFLLSSWQDVPRGLAQE